MAGASLNTLKRCLMTLIKRTLIGHLPVWGNSIKSGSLRHSSIHRARVLASTRVFIRTFGPPPNNLESPESSWPWGVRTRGDLQHVFMDWTQFNFPWYWRPHSSLLNHRISSLHSRIRKLLYSGMGH